jgi:hypothetical protein
VSESVKLSVKCIIHAQIHISSPSVGMDGGRSGYGGAGGCHSVGLRCSLPHWVTRAALASAEHRSVFQSLFILFLDGCCSCFYNCCICFRTFFLILVCCESVILRAGFFPPRSCTDLVVSWKCRYCRSSHRN